MSQIVTLTSQGQISIPVKIRRKLKMEKTRKIYVREEEGRVVLEPIPDLLELEGALQGYAMRGKPIEEVMEIEERAMGDAFAGKHKKR